MCLFEYIKNFHGNLISQWTFFGILLNSKYWSLFIYFFIYNFILYAAALWMFCTTTNLCVTHIHSPLHHPLFTRFTRFELLFKFCLRERKHSKQAAKKYGKQQTAVIAAIMMMECRRPSPLPFIHPFAIPSHWFIRIASFSFLSFIRSALNPRPFPCCFLQVFYFFPTNQPTNQIHPLCPSNSICRRRLTSNCSFTS